MSDDELTDTLREIRVTLERDQRKLKMPAKLGWLIAGFGFCFLTVGGYIWRGPYREYIHNAYPYEPLAVLAGAALLLPWLIRAGGISSAVAISCSYPAATLVRIVVDCAQQPSRHNLAPFELVFALGMGIIAAVPCAAIGSVLRRLTRK
jgi:hypothetical protein